MLNQGQVGPQSLADGVIGYERLARQGDTIVSQLGGRYSEQTTRRNVFHARATTTAMVIYSTAAATGGPLIWNPVGSGVNVRLLVMTACLVTASGVEGNIGLTGGTQTAAPGSTTAIDTTTNGYIGGGGSAATAYRVGTTTAAGTFFYPLFDANTGATTIHNVDPMYIDLGGMFVAPPGTFVSVAASATLTSAVIHAGLSWEEVPI